MYLPREEALARPCGRRRHRPTHARAATAGGATAIVILVAEVWACAAGAEDAIKPGKWENPAQTRPAEGDPYSGTLSSLPVAHRADRGVAGAVGKADLP